MNTKIVLSIVNTASVHIVRSGIFENIIGQNEARSSLDFFIRSHNNRTPFPTLLFTGGHGLGKTFFSSKVAQALDRNFVEINCGDIKTTDDFMHIVFRSVFQNNKPATILLDEVHSLSNEITTLLLTLLNPNSKHVNQFSYKGAVINWDMTLLNIIFSTTDAYKIFKPLRNRCQEVYFYPYTENDLFEIVKSYIPDIILACSKNDLALTCRGRARDAFILSTNIRRFVNISSNSSFSQDDLNKLKSMLGIMPMGLKRAEVELLKAVAEHGPISANNLAIKLMVNQNNIEDELEVRLRELSMIESSSRGRLITELGKNYLSQYKV